MVIAITQADADLEDKSLDELAEDYLNRLKISISKYRDERKLQNLILRGLGIFLSTIIVIFTFRFVNWL